MANCQRRGCQNAGRTYTTRRKTARISRVSTANSRERMRGGIPGSVRIARIGASPTPNRTMTREFWPPLETGLSGEKYLSERIEERHNVTPTEARSPGVYALVLSVPQDVDLREYWLMEYDTLPDYWESLVDAERVVYVGASDDAYGRIQEHIQSDARKAVLPSVFPPHSLERLWLYEDADEAFLRESMHATRLRNSRPEWFVRQG